jgi:hypothetical protein
MTGPGPGAQSPISQVDQVSQDKPGIDIGGASRFFLFQKQAESHQIRTVGLDGFFAQTFFHHEKGLVLIHVP